MGTYHEGEGAETRSHCKSCPEGVYCDKTGLSKAPVYYSDSDNAQFKSPPNGFNPKKLCSINNPSYATDCVNATPCAKGKYCEKATDGSVNQKDCPKGKYCPGERSYLVCEAGTY